MSKILESKLAAWVALLVVIVATCLTFQMFRAYWWAFTIDFFAFMMVFCQLASVYLYRLSPIAGRKLRMCALVMGMLTILSFIGVFIAFQVITE